jgi:hypothetical protein
MYFWGTIYEIKGEPNQMPTTPETNSESDAPEPAPKNPLSPSVEGNKNGVEGNSGDKSRQVQKTIEKPSHWWEPAQAVCAILLVIITAYYTYYAKQQAGAAITAANAAKSAAETAARTLKEMQTGQGATDTHTLAVAAGEQAKFSGKQVSGIKESNRINRESLESVQRAFVTFLHIEAPRESNTTNGKFFYEFMPVFQNSGNTPAKIVATSYGSNIHDEPSEAEFIGRADFTNITIGPKAIEPLGPARVQDEASIFDKELGDDLGRFREAKMVNNAVIWSWIVYRDGLPGTKPRLTEFCDGMVGAQLTPSGIAFRSRSCGHHNCTDEDCPDYRQIMKTVDRGPGADKHPLRPAN